MPIPKMIIIVMIYIMAVIAIIPFIVECGLGLSTRGHWDGPEICNERGGILARDAIWRKAPCERAAAAASPLPGSARGSTVCPVQPAGGPSNSITVTENTD